MQGWQLMLTGHSLWAGIAALLALKMLRTFRDAMHRPRSDWSSACRDGSWC